MDSAAPGKSPELPLEIWFKVLTCLLLPIPLPNSNPDRALLRQQALTVTARVNKSFNLISVKLLYKDVCTDRLDLFLFNCHTPSRQKLFAHTQSLFVEYREYDAAMNTKVRSAAWEAVWEAESEDLTAALKRVQKVKGGAKILFPIMTKVAVSSIYGSSSGLWADYKEWIREHTPGMEDFFGEGALDEGEHYRRPRHRTTIDKSNSAWGAFIAGSNVKHICTRNLSAPLVLSLFEAPSKSMANIDITAHMGEAEPGPAQFAAVVPGAKTRWSLEAPLDKPWQPICNSINRSLFELRFSPQNPQKPTSRPLHLDIYCSTEQLDRTDTDRAHPASLAQKGKDIAGIADARLSADTQRAVASLLGAEVQDRMRRLRLGKDVIHWHCAADVPICLACGTGPPA